MFLGGRLGWTGRSHPFGAIRVASSESTEERLKAALADRYRLKREIGIGGMATVYLAQDRKHDRKVAVKVLRLLPGAGIRNRLEDENPQPYPRPCELQANCPFPQPKILRPLSGSRKVPKPGSTPGLGKFNWQWTVDQASRHEESSRDPQNCLTLRRLVS